MLCFIEFNEIWAKSDKRSKLDACLELQRVVDAEILTIHDGVTIAELSRFEEQQSNVFKAAKGNHDDTVSALYWAVYATLQPEIDMDNIRIKEEIKQEDNMTIEKWLRFCKMSER